MIFERNSFFPLKKTLNLKILNSILSSYLIDFKIEKNFEIEDISSLDILKDNSIIFLNEDKIIESSLNLAVITDKITVSPHYKNYFLVKNLNEVYIKIINEMYLHEDDKCFQDNFDFIEGSYISKYSKIDKTVSIGKNSVIGRGVEIKSNSIIKNNVVIKNSIIGSDVVICDNTTIGSTGFGFDYNKRGANNLFPQIGIVQIDDNCHIGSNCTIDRAKIDFTYIGKNCMIDNLVHIGHNAKIYDNACIAAQTGISGSVNIGKNVTVGGQAGFAGHIEIGDNVVIAARSGVTKNIPDNSKVAGFPAIDIRQWRKNIIKERKNGHK